MECFGTICSPTIVWLTFRPQTWRKGRTIDGNLYNTNRKSFGASVVRTTKLWIHVIKKMIVFPYTDLFRTLRSVRVWAIKINIKKTVGIVRFSNWFIVEFMCARHVKSDTNKSVIKLPSSCRHDVRTRAYRPSSRWSRFANKFHFASIVPTVWQSFGNRPSEDRRKLRYVSPEPVQDGARLLGALNAFTGSKGSRLATTPPRNGF